MFSVTAFGYGVGYSSFPLKMKEKLLSAEATGILMDGGGIGMQGRFTYKAIDQILLDAGVGFSGGDRSSRLFAGADYEIFPDYMNQPRFSMKAVVERAKEFKNQELILGITPTVSKGFNFWGHEGFPYVAVPVGLGLATESNTYQTKASLTLGINGKLPFENYKNLTGSIETNFNLSNTYTAVFMGVSYSL